MNIDAALKKLEELYQNTPQFYGEKISGMANEQTRVNFFFYLRQILEAGREVRVSKEQEDGILERLNSLTNLEIKVSALEGRVGYIEENGAFFKQVQRPKPTISIDREAAEGFIAWFPECTCSDNDDIQKLVNAIRKGLEEKNV